MGKQAPAPQADYKALGNSIQSAGAQQVAANRPNQSTPWASSNWEKDQYGNWTQNNQLNGGLNAAAQGAMSALPTAPMDWNQFGTMGTGDQARDQAINAAYGQATSRLDPQWDHRESVLNTRLLNQGLDPSSEAYKNAMGDFGRDRNDAYGSAMNSAIGQGTAAGDSIFRNNLAGRQQSISEALRAYGQPMETLQGLQGFTAMPGFNQDNTTMAGALGNANLLQAGDQANLARWQAEQQANANMIGGIFGGLGGLAKAGVNLYGFSQMKPPNPWEE